MLRRYVPNYLPHISLIFNSCQIGIFGKRRLLNNCGIVYLARASILHCGIFFFFFFFSCKNNKICWIVFACAAPPPRPLRTAVCRFVHASGCGPVGVRAQGGRLVSHLLLTPQNPAVDEHTSPCKHALGLVPHTHTHTSKLTCTQQIFKSNKHTLSGGETSKLLF